jgi:hypothetical protein
LQFGASENFDGQHARLTRQDFGDQRSKLLRLGGTADPTRLALAPRSM